MRMGPSTKAEQMVELDLLEDLVSKLNRYCHFLTKDKWDSEDIAQETIVKILEHYNPENWSASLLKKIAYHVWIDRIRKQEKESLISHDKIPEKAEFVRGEICLEFVEEWMKQLSPKQLVTFILKEAFHFKITEIAALLEMSETGVKALLNRARARIKRLSDSNNEWSWPEEIRDILYPTVVQSISIEDPTVIIKLIPKFFTSSSVSNNALHHSPSNFLSLAA